MDVLNELERALDDADLGPCVDLNGHKFVFTSYHGSHSHALLGTITGVSWSDEGGLHLFTSITEFWGTPLLYLIRMSDNWYACAHVPGAPFSKRERSEHASHKMLEKEYYQGTLLIL